MTVSQTSPIDFTAITMLHNHQCQDNAASLLVQYLRSYNLIVAESVLLLQFHCCCNLIVAAITSLLI